MAFSTDEAERIWQKLKQGGDMSVGAIFQDTQSVRRMRVRSVAGVESFADARSSSSVSRDADLGYYVRNHTPDGQWGPWVKQG